MNSKQKEEKGLEYLLWMMPKINYVYGEKYDKIIKEIEDAYLNKGILQGYDAKPSHYNNENGSIYKFCNDQELNPWEFDIIKRIVRCRKKGQFKEDLEKTKMAIDLYLKEHNG